MHPIMRLSLAEQSQLRQMLLDGKSYSAIHQQLGISPPCISKYKKLLNLSIAPNPAGRPCLISKADARRVVRVILSGQVDTASEARNLLGLKVSKGTVKNVLRRAGLRGCVKVRKPLLKKQHLRDRLDFALTHRHKTPADWSKVFSLMKSRSTYLAPMGDAIVGRSQVKVSPAAPFPRQSSMEAARS
jgi:hypothetical protein